MPSTPPLHRRRDFLNKEAAVSLFAEFLEVAIETILYHRNGYPNGVFEKQVFLGAECWRSRYQLLRKYIRQQLAAILSSIVSGEVDRVIVVLVENGSPIECVVVDVSFCGNVSIQKNLLSDILSSSLHSLTDINTATPPSVTSLTWFLEAQCITGKNLPPSAGWTLSSREQLPTGESESTVTVPIYSSSAYHLQLQNQGKEAAIPFSLQIFIEALK
eukprot:TRINITY_DN4658_c5_g1_i1.p1 TRINITY_DN4658_c5_g1~~TRINITY_DN4658_c5_g1_i1.p1  ORF type:complete len:216 (+),score=29.11 TRINITY_DN4658_c5_g1_i1:146-793(+)